MKRSPLRKKSTLTVSKLKRDAWTYFSRFIRERDNWTCFTCGAVFRGAGMHAGHFVSRSKSNTFFDEMNVNAQCYPCNIHKRGNSGEYAYQLIRKYGEAEFKKLLKRGREIKQFRIPELQEILNKYKSLVE